jgi:hypothetical protein
MNDSPLYQLIRARAGSKMLRQAEAVLNYTEIYGLIMNNKDKQALNVAIKFDAEYPLLAEEIPMTPVTLDDIKNKLDILNLSWPYIHLLETLCADDSRAIAVINDVLGTTEGENKKESFYNFYSYWLIKNISWTKEFDCWYLEKMYESRNNKATFELAI